MTLDDLIGKLDAAGATYHVVRSGRGGYVMIPQGARVLGAWPDRDGENVFWLGECCDSGATRKTALNSGEWNFGGDRLWFLIEDGGKGRDGGLAREGPPSGHHFIQQ